MPENDSPSSLIDYVEKHLKRFSTNLEKAIESGDVEAVHDLRVASRRLTEPLKMLAPWMDKGRIKVTLRSLRKARRAFRKVRDLDVVQASVCNGAPLDSTDLAPLEGILTRRRQQ